MCGVKALDFLDYITLYRFSEVIESRRETPLVDLLRSYGGWPVLEGEEWNATDFDWISTITRLRTFNNDILVAIWVGPDGKDSDDFILQVCS